MFSSSFSLCAIFFVAIIGWMVDLICSSSSPVFLEKRLMVFTISEMLTRYNSCLVMQSYQINYYHHMVPYFPPSANFLVFAYILSFISLLILFLIISWFSVASGWHPKAAGRVQTTSSKLTDRAGKRKTKRQLL